MVTSMNTVILIFRTLGLFRPPEHLYQNSKPLLRTFLRTNLSNHKTFLLLLIKVVKNSFSQRFGHSRPQSPLTVSFGLGLVTT